MRLFINLSLNFAPHEIKDYNLLNWEARFLGPMVLQDGLQPVLGAFDCVLGGQATKSTVIVRPKDLICINFDLGGQISLDQ